MYFQIITREMPVTYFDRNIVYFVSFKYFFNCFLKMHVCKTILIKITFTYTMLNSFSKKEMKTADFIFFHTKGKNFSFTLCNYFNTKPSSIQHLISIVDVISLQDAEFFFKET